MRELDADEWERILADIGDFPPFYATGWLEAAQTHTRFRLIRVAITAGDEVIGISPMFLGDRRGLRILASPPPGAAAPYLGPLWHDLYGLKETTRLSRQEEFVHLVEDLAKATRATVILLRLQPTQVDIRPFIWRGFTCRLRHSYRVPLNRSEDAILRSFSHSVRRNIRKAEKTIEVHTGSISDLDWLIGAIDMRLGTQRLHTNLSRTYLEDVLRRLGPERAETLVARRGSSVVNATLDLIGPRARYGWVGATRPQDPADGSTQLIAWRGMQKARNAGLSWFEIIGADDPRLASFKAQFNPELARYYEVSRGFGIGKLVAWIRAKAF